MKLRSFITAFAILLGTLSYAQSPYNILDGVLSYLSKQGNISASYRVQYGSHSESGSLTMAGHKFKTSSTSAKYWYNGKTLWAYTPATNEVTITEPSSSELQTINPYASMRNYRTDFHVWKAYTQEQGYYTVKLMPKRKNTNLVQILLYIKNGTKLIYKAKVQDRNGWYIISISNYKFKQKLSPKFFDFDSSTLPKGVNTVDLR